MSAKGEATKQKPDSRVQRYAYVALAASVVLGAILAFQGDARLFGIELPTFLPLVLLAIGAIVAGAGAARRSDLLVGLGAAAIVLGVLPGGSARPSAASYALGALFGLALLLTIELVHMTERYERAHRAVETENVPEEHIDRVTDEALKTLATRVGLAGLAVALAFSITFLLAAYGPAQWRAAVETTAPIGVAVLGLALAGAASLFILARGATYRLRREPSPKELLPDVAE